MNSLQDLMLSDHGDLSYRYGNPYAGENKKRGEQGGNTNERLRIVSQNRSISSSGGSEADDDDMDSTDDIVILSESEEMSDSVSRKLPPGISLTNKVKLSFSMDSILSGEIEQMAEKKRLANERLQSISQHNIGQFDFNAHTGLHSFADSSIIRPMPVRYSHNTQTATSYANLHTTHGQFPQLFKFTNPSNTNQISSLSLSETSSVLPIHLAQLRQNLTTFENLTVKRNLMNNTSPNSSPVNSPKSLLSSKRKRSWSRAVFSQLQRKGLEIQFQIQKYITKPDRRKLAARLGLTDAQVKVWFQNRRMKWRHTRENRINQERLNSGKKDSDNQLEIRGDYSTSTDDESYSISSCEDEIDVVAE